MAALKSCVLWVVVCPSENIEALTPSTEECEMGSLERSPRSHEAIRVGQPIVTDVLIKRGNLDTEMCAEGTMNRHRENNIYKPRNA